MGFSIKNKPWKSPWESQHLGHSSGLGVNVGVCVYTMIKLDGSGVRSFLVWTFRATFRGELLFIIVVGLTLTTQIWETMITEHTRTRTNFQVDSTSLFTISRLQTCRWQDDTRWYDMFLHLDSMEHIFRPWKSSHSFHGHTLHWKNVGHLSGWPNSCCFYASIWMVPRVTSCEVQLLNSEVHPFRKKWVTGWWLVQIGPSSLWFIMVHVW